jgi:transcriptional regulator with GAF, ATPase, and Fis domain
MADGGTLFLDEIGDMPLELQPKLLRALQEREFERLGSTQTIRVNVRVVAATNQDLWELVNKKLFRADLFYRLNVIPISLPPLRERIQDILPLTKFFVAKFAGRLNKTIDSIPEEGGPQSARLAG